MTHRVVKKLFCSILWVMVLVSRPLCMQSTYGVHRYIFIYSNPPNLSNFQRKSRRSFLSSPPFIVSGPPVRMSLQSSLPQLLVCMVQRRFSGGEKTSRVAIDSRKESMRSFLSGFEGIVKIIVNEGAQLYHRLDI